LIIIIVVVIVVVIVIFVKLWKYLLKLFRQGFRPWTLGKLLIFKHFVLSFLCSHRTDTRSSTLHLTYATKNLSTIAVVYILSLLLWAITAVFRNLLFASYLLRVSRILLRTMIFLRLLFFMIVMSFMFFLIFIIVIVIFFIIVVFIVIFVALCFSFRLSASILFNSKFLDCMKIKITNFLPFFVRRTFTTTSNARRVVVRMFWSMLFMVNIYLGFKTWSRFNIMHGSKSCIWFWCQYRRCWAETFCITNSSDS
jgi:hypothetical protein